VKKVQVQVQRCRDEAEMQKHRGSVVKSCTATGAEVHRCR